MQFNVVYFVKILYLKNEKNDEKVCHSYVKQIFQMRFLQAKFK